jgi:mercuric reductase
MSSTELDLVAIGTGGAAMAAAINARQQGASVVLVEGAILGGTCVNVGSCPPRPCWPPLVPDTAR